MKTSKENKGEENKKKAKPVKNATNKIGNKNITKHTKARANFIKNFKSFKKINIIRSLNGSIEIKNENKKETQKNNIEESLLKKINDAKNMLYKIGYLQLWWKTMFQIIKIQKYLRGFLYRIKLLKLLELKEKIVYGNILLSQLMKRKFFNLFKKKLKKLKKQKKPKIRLIKK